MTLPRVSAYFLLLLLFAAPVPGGAQIRWAEHPMPLPEAIADQVSFGYLSVPEDRENPETRDIEIAFTRIRNTAGRDCADPVIILPGGPGQGLSSALNRFSALGWFERILEDRDIVLFDPRGCGLSQPKLCPNINERSYFYRSVFLQGQAWRDNLRTAMGECADSLAARRVAVGSYHSVAIARDIEDLRRALDYERWNLRGHSYGSYYGFTLMQEFPAVIRSAFLSGIMSLQQVSDHSQRNFLNAFGGLIVACKDDRTCSEAYPQLDAKLAAVLDRLDKDPIEVRLPGDGEDGYHSYYLTPGVFLVGLQNLLYQRAGIEFIPALIDCLHDGNDWVIQNVAELLLRPDGLDREMLTIIWSNDADPNLARPHPDTRKSAPAFVREEWLPKELSGRRLAWNILRGDHVPPPRSFRKLAIPTVLISGEMDPVTPPEQGELMRKYLTEAVHHVVPGAGHYAYNHVDFAFDRFLDDPERELARGEVYPTEPLSFVTAIDYNRGVSGLMADLAKGNYLSLLLPLTALLLALIALLILTVRSVRARFRSTPAPPERATPLPATLAAVTLLSGGLLVWAILDSLAENPFVVTVGLPSAWGVLSAVLVAQLLLVATGLFWWKRIWRSSGRVPGTMALLGAAAFGVFVVVGGLLG